MMSEQITFNPALKVQYNLSAGMFKEKSENHNYTILVHLALIDENGAEKKTNDLEVKIKFFDTGFYDRLLFVIEEEIEQLNKSQKNIERIG